MYFCVILDQSIIPSTQAITLFDCLSPIHSNVIFKMTSLWLELKRKNRALCSPPWLHPRSDMLASVKKLKIMKSCCKWKVNFVSISIYVNHSLIPITSLRGGSCVKVGHVAVRHTPQKEKNDTRRSTLRNLSLSWFGELLLLYTVLIYSESLIFLTLPIWAVPPHSPNSNSVSPSCLTALTTCYASISRVGSTQLEAPACSRCSRSRRCQHLTSWIPSVETCKSGSCWSLKSNVPNHKYHILGCSNPNYLNESLTFCGKLTTCWAGTSHHAMTCNHLCLTYPDVSDTYTIDTLKRRNTWMCRGFTLCVTDLIWGVCFYSYTPRSRAMQSVTLDYDL